MARSIEQWPARVPRAVFIVDDHPIFREGMAEVITAEKDLKLCGSAGTAAEALQGIVQLKPDIVLLDISLPDKSGLEVIKEVRRLDQSVKLLVVSMHDEALYANQVLEMGADGYIMKVEDPVEIVQAIRDVLDGRIYVSDEVLARPAKEHPQRRSRQPARPLAELGDRELEVLELLGQNQSETEIADQLSLDPGELDDILAGISRKLSFKSHRALIRYAVGWVKTCNRR